VDSAIIIPILGIIISAIGLIIILQHRNLRLLRDLCELRQNSIDCYRDELKLKIAFQLALANEVNGVIQATQRFYQRYQRLREAPQYEQGVIMAELTKAQTVNEDLVQEFSKLLLHNQTIEGHVSRLREKEKRLEDVMLDNFELRTKLQKLEERNQEVEYALNLESISMIEGYDERDKLYTAIDDVRRSLTRILNSA
jgi:ribosome-associated translation inhibitor RaiA